MNSSQHLDTIFLHSITKKPLDETFVDFQTKARQAELDSASHKSMSQASANLQFVPINKLKTFVNSSQHLDTIFLHSITKNHSM